MLFHNKDDIQFVTEFPRFLGHPVYDIMIIYNTKFNFNSPKKSGWEVEIMLDPFPFLLCLYDLLRPLSLFVISCKFTFTFCYIKFTFTVVHCVLFTFHSFPFHFSFSLFPFTFPFHFFQFFTNLLRVNVLNIANY